MTEQPNDPSMPGDEPPADEPAGPAPSGADETTTGTSREWMSQLETMIQDVANQAAPVARQIAAKAAELTAVAAVKAGPLAQRAAVATTDAGQKLAERAQSLAAELRGEAPGTPVEDVPWGAPDGAGQATGDASGMPPADAGTEGDQGEANPAG
jgi:hypothetical protein